MTPSDAEPAAAAVNYFEAPETALGRPTPAPDDAGWRAIRLVGLPAEARVNFVGLARYAFASFFASGTASTLSMLVYLWRTRRRYADSFVIIVGDFYWVAGTPLVLALLCGIVGEALRSRRQWALRAEMALALGLTLDFAAMLAFSSFGSEALHYLILVAILGAYWATALAARPSKTVSVFTDEYREAVRQTPDLRPVYRMWAKLLIGAMALLAILMWVVAVANISASCSSLEPLNPAS